MQTSIRRSVRVATVALSLFAAGSASAGPYGSLVVFGDSLSDSGNNAAAGLFDPTQVITGNAYVPSSTYASSVYSNGPVWASDFATILGVPLMPSLLGGTNFAFGGATTDTPGSGPGGFPFSLLSQASQYLGTSGGYVSPSTLYVIAGGGNDVRAALFAVGGGADPLATIGTTTDSFVANIGTIVDELQAAGAMHILVWDVPNVGLAPAVVAGGGASFATLLAGTMNVALANRLAGEAGVNTFDIFGLGTDIAAHPALYGFTNAEDACGAVSGADCDRYAYWDGIHPTAAAHRDIANALAVAAVPEPETWALLLGGLALVMWTTRRGTKSWQELASTQFIRGRTMIRTLDVRRQVWLTTTVLMAGVSVLGGCSGGGGFLGGDPCANNGCNVTISPSAFVSPARLAVQGGTPVTFSSSTNVTAAIYQWQRAPDGVNFIDIAGATGSTYTTTAQLSDDAATFRLRVSGANGQSAFADAALYVSSVAPIIFADTEFADASWVPAVVANPLIGTTYSASQAASGGNPGAWRQTVVSLPNANASVTVYDISTSSAYEPAAQGAIRAIDYIADCTIVNSAPSIFSATIVFRQAGRNYSLKAPTYCNSPNWLRIPYSALLISDFIQVSGPACTVNETCPDFSANGPDIHFGYSLATSGATGTFDRGLDNWRVTVWRR
jgi:outer membrane lipase/esterase